MVAALLAGLARGPLLGYESITLFAAASTTEAVRAVVESYRTATGSAVTPVFGGSATLAKQIAAGAPADLFLSADEAWMDHLATTRSLAPDTRIALLGNSLVLIAQRDHGFPVTVDRTFDFPAAFAGRFAIADPAVVPIGRYAKQAFTALGWWERLADRLAPVADVRAALRLVEQGEVDAGVVYATDAAASTAVTVLARIPDALHAPVVYPLACTAGARPEARAFLAYLTGPVGRAAFTARGFTWLPPVAP